MKIHNLNQGQKINNNETLLNVQPKYCRCIAGTRTNYTLMHEGNVDLQSFQNTSSEVSYFNENSKQSSSEYPTQNW